jgi:hypothetical protein
MDKWELTPLQKEMLKGPMKYSFAYGMLIGFIQSNVFDPSNVVALVQAIEEELSGKTNSD